MCQDPANAVHVLALLASECVWQSLRDIFVHSNWRLQFAGTLNELRESLKNSQLGVVITDSCLSDCGWKAVLETADRTEHQPSVIVGSRLADDGLWAVRGSGRYTHRRTGRRMTFIPPLRRISK